MRPIYPKIPDSLQVKDKDEFKGAEQDATDTLAAAAPSEDSVYAITKDKEVKLLKYDLDSAKYRIENVHYKSDQDIYMWYLRDVLVLPDVRAATEDEKSEKSEKKKRKEEDLTSATKVKKEKGIKNFFKKDFTFSSERGL